MQGIYLAFQGCEKNILKTLLSGIDFSDYQFDVGHFEARKEFFLHPDWEYLEEQALITSDEAKKRLLENENDYEVIENLSLLVRNKTTRKKKIQTFKDLVDGDYEIALKVIDHSVVQVFSTKESVLKKIMCNVKGFDAPLASIRPFEHVELNTLIGV
ncbi:MAG: hypothetical protein A2Y45_02310 [Tenericutes bacterium GWC2_34_14]|nr:MAG: hypothetical protein A2Z84_00185 [Tenericutes bacterium GWA2_35_7]OHE28069.1 MAG: hypothetical protein A2Y45_02310 [Tenericutes bacterium GWC2_34_14]OHE32990.1 MAG: hypothetical protein A2012_09920 [Tenericutes bacterium GWE2_34_108]OHE36044.1 MAG: hypothetical protein A2Y46_06490 [Tenericutes bacterium GWF1_35_14]OHE39267.1 MAG: hypothetical protein A2Y44_05850 [Tenericutes bacterium GWF2_35_184]OHE44542.1 MAG: hypothetical protein A2221_01685 [Tenericutes bacterium RIFOXYA2_FULL_36_3